MTAMSDLPSFEAAVNKLKEFLLQQGCPSEIAWTFFEDYAWLDQMLYVNEDEFADNARHVERLYSTHPMRGHGVELSLVAILDEVSLCSIWIPSSEEEAESRLLSGLKLRIPTRQMEAHAVDDGIEWHRVRSAEQRLGGPSPVGELLRKSERTQGQDPRR
jgi:hypothetical protein